MNGNNKHQGVHKCKGGWIVKFGLNGKSKNFGTFAGDEYKYACEYADLIFKTEIEPHRKKHVSIGMIRLQELKKKLRGQQK